jgi:hypothetical protein
MWVTYLDNVTHDLQEAISDVGDSLDDLAEGHMANATGFPW